MEISLFIVLVASLLGLGIAPVKSHSKEPHPLDVKSEQTWKGHVSSKTPQLTPPPSVDCQNKPQADLPFCR